MGAPEYARPQEFEETEVLVGSGPLAVPGTLTVPRAVRSCPGVVLLAGSGPNDRDGTIGRNKPLKDVAWGLARFGIAVLRFDKVTFAHPAEVKADLNFTVVDEYVNHATFALHILTSDRRVDGRRVFVAGHSLGGTVAPRVAVRQPTVAGLVLLAAGQPLYWSAVRQVRYLASLNPATSAASETVIDTMTQQAAARSTAPTYRRRRRPASCPSEYPPRTGSTSAGTSRPRKQLIWANRSLFSREGRYQVTVDDDLVTWRQALDGRPDVSIRVYPADNHFFFSGSGPSAPDESEPAQHVDAEVIFDVGNWVNSGRLPGEAQPQQSL